MSYTLVGSIRSPFSRKVRLFLANNSIDFEFKAINYLEKPEDAAYLAKLSPTNKIPVLIDDGEKIYDSRVIVNHLVRKHQLKPLTIEQENIQTVVESCMDTSVNLFFLKSSGLNAEPGNWYLDRQRERIKISMEYLLPWIRQLSIDKSDDWNYPVMSLYSYLDWGKARGLSELDNIPELSKFLELFANARGLAETDFRVP